MKTTEEQRARWREDVETMPLVNKGEEMLNARVGALLDDLATLSHALTEQTVAREKAEREAMRDLDHDIGLLDLLGAKDDETIAGAAARLVGDLNLVSHERDAATARYESLVRAIYAAYDTPLAADPETALKSVVERGERMAAIVACIKQWTHEYGSELHPRGDDTYGNGVRDSKSRVSALLASVKS